MGQPHKNGKCNHTAARKVGGPQPTPSPGPQPTPSPPGSCGKPCKDDSDCSDSTCSWCSSPKPGAKNNQTCSGPPSPNDCGSLPMKNSTDKLQYASWGDSVSNGLFHPLSKLLADYE